MQTLSENDKDKVSRFFKELDVRINLSHKEKMKITADFENALIFYRDSGVPLETALSRMDAVNLGGFYVRPPILWYPLDDAAKLYPLSMERSRMSVFRLSVYLKNPVVPEILQIALTFVIKRFPTFATTVKKGFFWHYLDASKCRYSVSQESSIPCRPLKISRSRSQSFRVFYHGRRISIECFHVLTDGAGGLVFIKTLTAEYLRLLGIETAAGGGIPDINETPPERETFNEFSRAGKDGSGNSDRKVKLVSKPAVQMSGRLSKSRPCRIVHFNMDASLLKAAAKGRNSTVTAYILELMFIAEKHATDELKGIKNIQVPVNLRKFYNSDTLRNFSAYCGVSLELSSIGGTGSVIDEISLQLNRKSEKQSMDGMVNSIRRLVSAMKYVPLFIKNPAVKTIYGFLGDMEFSSTFSNLGIASMPADLAEHIDRMDAVIGGSMTNRARCAMITFKNTATLSVTKMTADPSFEEKLFSLLSADGIIPSTEGSELYEN